MTMLTRGHRGSAKTPIPDTIDYIEEPLPYWASYKGDGYYMIEGAMLPTRDGRRLGNAYVDTIDSYYYNVNQELIIFAICYTDIGSKMRLTLAELKEMFYPPPYVMNKFEARKTRGIK